VQDKQVFEKYSSVENQKANIHLTIYREKSRKTNCKKQEIFNFFQNGIRIRKIKNANRRNVYTY